MLFNQLCSKCHSRVVNIKVYSDYFYISLLFNVIMHFARTTHLRALEPYFKCSVAVSFLIILLSTEGRKRKTCYLASRFSSFLNLLWVITQKTSLMHVELINEYSKRL